MLNPLRLGVAVTLVAALVMGWSDTVQASEPPAPTVVTVGEMCGGCVKKITARFADSKGIASVQCDIESKTATFFPAVGYRLSPRGLWVSMEEIGKTPVRLEGPSGVFTSKPSS